MYSACLCSKKQSSFIPYITYKNETVFKDFEGIIIGRCKKCGLLKTFPPKNIQFDPQQSRKDMYESQKDYFIELFLPIVNKIKQYKPSGKILDVGCSSGILLELLKKNGYDIYGAEPNIHAFKIASKKFPKKIIYGTIFDVSKHKKNIQFDVIIYNHVLEHVNDIKMEIILIKKMLKKDGIFVLGLPNTSNCIFLLRKKYWEPLMPLEHVWHFSKNYLTAYLKKNGFTIINIGFSDDSRNDYPLLKRFYFSGLSLINKLFNTGESMLIISSSPH